MIIAENLSIHYEGKHVFSGLNFHIKRGEKAALKGPSGSGKTSLLNLMAGFIPDYSGKLLINGEVPDTHNIKQIRRWFAWVPQNVSLNQEFVKDLFDVTFGFVNNNRKKPGKEQILELFKVFNLEEEIYGKAFNEISIGQKQRVLLCNAVLMKKPIMILDEPTAALDNENKIRVCDYLFGIKDLTMIAATHDDYWLGRADQVIAIND
jgi:putative ABC transport system ATP-binding protein